MVTAARVLSAPRGLAVIVPVASRKAPVPPVTEPWTTEPLDSRITPYRMPPERSTAMATDPVSVLGSNENLSTS
jgi:hypothetical protein